MPNTDPLCLRCANPECEYSGRNVRTFICFHDYVAPPKTNYDSIIGKTLEEMADFLTEQQINAHMRFVGPKSRDEFLAWLKEKADDAA